MSQREQAIQLLNDMPEFEIDCVIAYMQEIMSRVRASEPNDETIAAMKELENGGGECFETLGELWASLEE